MAADSRYEHLHGVVLTSGTLSSRTPMMRRRSDSPDSGDEAYEAVEYSVHSQHYHQQQQLQQQQQLHYHHHPHHHYQHPQHQPRLRHHSRPSTKSPTSSSSSPPLPAPQPPLTSSSVFRTELIAWRIRDSSSTEEDSTSLDTSTAHSKSSCSSSQSHSAAIFEAFRPRSKSDSKESLKQHHSHRHHRNNYNNNNNNHNSRRPASNIMSAIKNSVHTHHWFSANGSSNGSNTHSLSSSPTCESPQGPASFSSPSAGQSPNTFQYPASSPDGFDYRPQSRPRSGSESKSGAVAKVMDMFRTRSQSMSLTPESKAKKFSHSQSASLFRRHSVDPDRRRTAAMTCVGPRGERASLDSGSFEHGHHTALIYRTHSHGTVGHGPPGSIHRQDSQLSSSSGQYDSMSSSSYVPGLISSDTSICEDRIDIEDLGADENLLFVKFFRYYHCYDLIPLSAKLVVFDTQLQVKKAFFALESNGVRAAPLWDSNQQQFVGMLTISDFILILRKYYRNPQLHMDELEQHKIDTWRTVLTDMQRPLVSIGPDASLCDAITALIQQRVHRLPVIDSLTGNVLYVLTHKRILRFLFLYFYDLPHSAYLNKSIRELNVGTFENIATCTLRTPLITALDTFVERRVSALPVVGDDGLVVDIYAKFDVINLAAEKTYSKLDMSVGQALEFRNEVFEGVLTCSPDDSLQQVMQKIVAAEVHRLVVVDDDGHCVGMISLSDILSFLVLTPLGMERLPPRSYLMRATSSDRENGTVEEEPELEATANVFGEQAVHCGWMPHGISSAQDAAASAPSSIRYGDCGRHGGGGGPLIYRSISET